MVLNSQRLQILNSQKVLVLSTGYEPLFKTNWKRALSAIFAGRAEVIEAHDTLWIGTPQGRIQFPVTVRFVTGIFTGKIKKLKKASKPSKKMLWYRDNGMCQYCRKKLKLSDSTIDHVIAKSKGGRNTWQNLVIACVKCNQKKGNRHPRDCNMKLIKSPSPPSDFIPVVL